MKWNDFRFIFGYVGLFYTCKLAIKIFRKIISKLFYSNILSFNPSNNPNLQSQTFKYVLVNFIIEIDSNNLEFIKIFLSKGFRIILLLKREDKKFSKFLLQKLKLKEEEVILKTYSTKINISLSEYFERKFKSYNISIFVNYMNTMNDHLNIYFSVLKVILKKMIMSRGKSLIIGLANKINNNLMIKDFNYKLAKNFHNQIKEEYNSKVEVLFIKNKSKNSIIKTVHKLRLFSNSKCEINLNQNFLIFNSNFQFFMYYLKKYIL